MSEPDETDVERTEMNIVCRFLVMSHNVDQLRFLANEGNGELQVHRDSAMLELITLRGESTRAAGLDDALEGFAEQCQNVIDALDPALLAGLEVKEFRITIMSNGSMNAGAFVPAALLSLATRFHSDPYFWAL